MVAHVQADAVGEVASGIETVSYPVAAGARRALHGLRLRTGAGVLHGLDVDLPLRHDGASVITVHDLSVLDVPWAHDRWRTRGERLLLARAVRRADAVVAVSEFTARRVEAHFGRQATVTHLAPGEDMRPPDPGLVARVRGRYRLPAGAVLCVGTIEPRKRLPLLASACQIAGLPLVLAGGVRGGEDLPPSARHLGYVPAEDLPALYVAADVVAYASAYEGFGLPPVEAMACGAAVVATRVGALPDVLDGAVLDSLVPPEDEAALARALREAVLDTDRNDALRRSGLHAVSHLTWERTAAVTRDVYRSLGASC